LLDGLVGTEVARGATPDPAGVRVALDRRDDGVAEIVQRGAFGLGQRLAQLSTSTARESSAKAPSSSPEREA
jgi:hypothetical protein